MSTPDGRTSGRGRALRGQGSAAAGGGLLAAKFVVTAGMNYGFAVALAWMLEPTAFAQISVLQNILALSVLLLGAGFPYVVARDVARAERGDGAVDLDAVLRSALVGNAVLGGLLASTILLVQQTGAAPLHGASPLLVAAVVTTILVLAVQLVQTSALQGARRFAALAVVQTGETLVKVVVGLVLVALVGLRADGVALGALVGALLAAAVAWWATADVFPRRGPLGGAAAFRAALPIAGGVSAVALLGTLDVLLLAGLLDSAAPASALSVAAYQVAAVLGRAVYFIGGSLAAAVFPYLARHGPGPESHAWFVAATRWVPLALVPLQLVLVVAPEVPLGLAFPDVYADVAAPLLRLLAVGSLGLLLTQFLLNALVALGGAGQIVARLPLAVALEVVLIVVLVPSAGATGAAAGFCAGSWMSALLLGRAYLRLQRCRVVARQAFVLQATALAALVPPLLLARVVRESAGLALIAVGLLAYAALARWFGLLNDEDMARGRRALAAVRGRLSGARRQTSTT